MMTSNVGGLERTLRIIVGVVIISAGAIFKADGALWDSFDC
ncbi:MAG: hypothetical protein ACJAYB_002058 [Psychromonas sp.]|jgi:hypothetical protein